MKPLDKVLKARGGLLLDSPFYATILLKLGIVLTDSVPTMGTDGKTLYVNLDFVDSLTLKQVRGVLLHEAWHVVSKHMLRLGDREITAANIAMDGAINPLVRSACGSDAELPPGAVFVQEWVGWNFEAIYAKLKIEKVQMGGGGQGKGQGQGQNQGQNSITKNDDGTWTVRVAGASSCGEVIPLKGTEAERRAAEQEIDISIQQAYNVAKSCGKVPADIARLMDELQNPKLPWREILARFASQIVKGDYSWSKPNRRWVQHGLYLPYLRSLEIGKVVFLVDTSGSIGRDEVTWMGSEIQGAFRAFPAVEVPVVYVDSRVAGTETFSTQDIPLRLNPQGGGGTDFRPGFDWIREQDFDPVAVFYFTDGYCSSFPDSAPCPVLWLLTENGVKEFNPPFGEVVWTEKD